MALTVDPSLRESPQDAKTSAPRLRHVPALDGLRGVAVLGVIFFHGGHLRGGYLGVDLFFVLSGYLITSLLVVEWRASGDRVIDKARFWGRRARRLLPALFVVLVFVAAIAQQAVAPIDRGRLRGDGLATIFYVANWHAIGSTSGYWAQTLSPSWLEHTWSLAIEEQFYVIWPLVVIAVLALARRRGASDTAATGGLLAVAAIGAVASAGWMIAWFTFGHPGIERLYLGTDTRAAALLIGASLACWQQIRGHTSDGRRRRSLTAVAVVAVGFLAIAWVRVGGTDASLYQGVLAACGLAVAALVADATHPQTSILARCWSLKPLCWLGLISYGLYLWHWPIFQYLGPDRTHVSNPWLLFILRFAVSIAAATLSFFIIERPIRQRRFLRGTKSLLAAPAVAGLVIIAILVGTSGAIEPAGGFARNQKGGYIDGGPGATRLMVLGDSVAGTLAIDGIAPLTHQLHVSLLPRAIAACDPDYSSAASDSLHFDCSRIFGPTVSKWNPEVVMVVFSSWKATPLKIDGKTYRACDPPFRKTWYDDLQRSLKKIERVSHAPIVLVGTPGTDNGFVLDRYQGLHDVVRCSNEVVRQVADADPQVRFVDLTPFACPGGPCLERIGNVYLRPDFQHFRGEGAQLAARWLIPKVLAAARGPG